MRIETEDGRDLHDMSIRGQKARPPQPTPVELLCLSRPSPPAHFPERAAAPGTTETPGHSTRATRPINCGPWGDASPEALSASMATIVSHGGAFIVQSTCPRAQSGWICLCADHSEWGCDEAFGLIHPYLALP